MKRNVFALRMEARKHKKPTPQTAAKLASAAKQMVQTVKEKQARTK